MWAAAVLMVPVGVGGSFTVPPLTAMVLDHVPSDRAGTASGVLNTARQMGGSLGVAVFGAVLATQNSFLVGLRLDVAVTAGVLVILAVASLRLHRANPASNAPLAL